MNAKAEETVDDPENGRSRKMPTYIMGHETKAALAELGKCGTIAHFAELCAAARRRNNR